MITSEPLRPAELLASVAHPSCGAVDLFLGVVRAEHEGRAVAAVTYDAFAPLAERVLSAVRAEASERFGARVAAAHRTGRLEVGQASLVVAAAAPHRGGAFAACRWVVDELKARLPVWKKEHYADGSAAWLDGCVLSAR